MRAPLDWVQTVVVALAALACAVLLACSDSPTVPGSSELHLELIDGDGQRGLAGLTLFQPVILRVVDGNGNPRAGVAVDFEVLQAGGLIRSSSDLSRGQGIVSAKWRLTGPVGSTQRMRAHLTDSGVPSTVTIEATVLDPDQADVVVFRNALGPLRGVLVVSDEEDGMIDILQEQRIGDTIVHLQPMGAGESDLLVFPQSNLPQRTSISWTEGVDTAYVDLRPPFELAVKFKVFEGPFDERVAVIQQHMAMAQEVWEKEGMGVVFGNVTFVDETEGDAEVDLLISGSSCSQPRYGSEIEVSYVHFLNTGTLPSFSCGNMILMGLRSEDIPLALGHELGHLFGLQHATAGVMKAYPPGTLLRDGEVFRAHFSRYSVLNWLFELHPEDLQRTCYFYFDRGTCLPVTYGIPDEIAG